MTKICYINLSFKLFLYISVQKIILSYIKLPLYTYHSYPPNNTRDISYAKYFSENNLYTYLNMGSPPQKIVATLNFNDYPFFIYYNRCEVFSSFDIEKSKTYIKRPFQYLLTNIYVYTYLVNDYFYFNFYEKYNLTYLFSPLNNNTSEKKLANFPYTCAQIGLKLSIPDLKSYNYNFIRELKLSKAIKDYVFFIEYDEKDDDKGNLIIGNEPYEYNNKKYKSIQLKEINAMHTINELYWDLKFNSIYFYKKKEYEKELKTINLEVLDGGLDHNLNIIVATYEFYQIIEKEFFEEKIKNKLCNRNRLEMNYYNYDCAFLEDVQEFPTLYFFHRNLNFTFKLDYKDLFIEYKGRFVSLIWIDFTYRNFWKFGKPFLKKYFFSFNLDKKIIGFYNNNITDINTDNIISNKSKYVIYSIIILLLLGIIAALCFIFAKTIYFKKKKFVFENITSELMYIRNLDKK